MPVASRREYWGEKDQRSLYLPKLLWEALDELSAAMKTTRTELIEEFLRESVKATAADRFTLKALEKVKTL